MSESPSTASPSAAPLVRSFRHTLERKPGSLVVLTVEADADRLSRAADRAFERHVRQAKIPGFRPGKAPRAMYERTYGTEHLWDDAAETVAGETIREICDLEGLIALDTPQVDVTQLEAGKPLTYTASFPVKPEVELGDYRSHGVAVEPKPLTDDDVNRTIERMREAHADLRAVERPATAGDIVTVDVDVAIEGKALPPFARNAHLEAGKETVILGLGEGLVGMKAGDDRRLELGFPADFVDEDVRGKTGAFAVRASAVSEKLVPALDDEFAKTVGVESVAALDRAVRSELAHAAFHEARDDAADKAVGKILEAAQVELPEVLVQDELEHLMADLKQRVRERGLTLEQFLLQARKTEGELREEWRPGAERRAKSLLVLEEIARKEGVTVSSNELAAEVSMTPLAQQDARALRDPAVLAAMARSLRNRKTVDKLLGIDAPDAERALIERAGGPPMETAPEPPKIVVPLRSSATPAGREAIRAELEKKP